MKKIMGEKKTKLVDHFYVWVTHFEKMSMISKKPKRRTRLVNVYNNKLREKCQWKNNSRRAKKLI